MKLRYSEAFYSVQGEGRFVGILLFLRTFGCNCLNFGVDRGEAMRDEKNKKMVLLRNAEVQGLIDNNVHKDTKEFNDLSIIHTGCDTYASIRPEFKHYNMLKGVDEVVEHFVVQHPMANGCRTMDKIYNELDRRRPVGVATIYVELFEHPYEGFEECYI